MPSPRSAKANPAPPEEARVFLLTGPDSNRKAEEMRRLLRENVDESFADFDAEALDGARVTADQVLSAVATAPLGGGKRVVTVRDTQQMEPEEQKRLGAGLVRVPSSGILALHTGAPIVEDGKVKRQSVVVTELLNAVKKSGQVLEFGYPKPDDLRGYILQEARRIGKTVSPDAVALLVQLPAEDVGRIRTELAKAAAYAGDSPTISGADVEATLSRSPDDVIFKLCDAVGMRRAPEALGYVSILFRSGGRPESIAPRTLALLARQIRLIAQFRYLGEQRMVGRGAQGVTPEALALLPGDGAGAILNNPRTRWMADKYVSQARNFTLPELEWRLERLLAADLALKGIEPGGDLPKAVLQRLVVELC